MNCHRHILKSIFESSFKVYLVSVSSTKVISLQCSHVNNLPFIIAGDLPHCGQHFMDDAIFTEVDGNCTESEISSFRLDFDFPILSFNGLIHIDGVVVINNIPLGHSLTFVCCTK